MRLNIDKDNYMCVVLFYIVVGFVMGVVFTLEFPKGEYLVSQYLKFKSDIIDLLVKVKSKFKMNNTGE